MAMANSVHLSVLADIPHRKIEQLPCDEHQHLLKKEYAICTIKQGKRFIAAQVLGSKASLLSLAKAMVALGVWDSSCLWRSAPVANNGQMQNPYLRQALQHPWQ
eukprot:1148716-Pelagomonas_calceolata.AAC.1